MRFLGKTLIVNRGDTAELTCNCTCTNGSITWPYMLQSNILNPYAVITIDSNSYDTDGQYHCVYWLDLNSYPTYDDIVPHPKSQIGKEEGNYLYFEGTKIYNADGSLASDFIIKKQFTYEQTKELLEGNYKYSIKIIGGSRTNGVLKSIYSSVYPYRPWKPLDSLTLYNEIKKCKPDAIKTIDPTAPLVGLYVVDTLQKDEKLIVK